LSISIQRKDIGWFTLSKGTSLQEETIVHPIKKSDQAQLRVYNNGCFRPAIDDKA
jgi:hypothetical protein